MDDADTRQQGDVPDFNEDADALSIESLIEIVDNFQKRQDLDTIERLERENAILHHQISCYKRCLKVTMELFKETSESALLIRNPLHDCDDEKERADQNWLAFWGICERCISDGVSTDGMAARVDIGQRI